MKFKKIAKRFLSVMLASVMTMSMWTVPAGAEEAETEEPLVKILTMSDYQKWLPGYSGDDWDFLQTQLTGIVNGAYEAGVDPDYMFFGGDYSCLDSASLTETGKSQVDRIVREKWPNLTDDMMFISQGNHDPGSSDGLMETGGYETDDFLVYLLNEDIFPSKQGTSEAKGIVEDAAADLEEWLLMKVDEGETRPIFILSHTGLHYDIDRADGNNQYAYKIFDVVNEAAKYLDVVFMFGHNHTNGDELVGGSLTFFPKGHTLDVCTETSIADRSGTTSVINFTYMNYGYIGYIGDIYNNQSPYKVTNELTVSELWIFEDRIEVYRFNKDGLLEEYNTVLDRDAADEPEFGDTYTLSYESNGGTGISDQKTTQSWNTVNRTAPSKSGADFLYWSTKEDGTGNRYQPGDSIYVAGDTTLYAQYSGGEATGDAAVFELTEELKEGETYLLAWNSELYSDEGTRYALTNGGSANVTAMNTSWVSEDGTTISVPAGVNTATYQWVCGTSGEQYTFKNASTNNYLAHVNSALSFVSANADTCLWNVVMNADSADDRAPAGIVLCNLVPNNNASAFIRYSVGGGQLKMGKTGTSTDTANSDVTFFEMTSSGDQAWHEHEFGEYTSDENGTCFVDGTQSRSCDCGVVETLPLQDSMVDHEYVYPDGGRTDSRNHYSKCVYCGGTKGIGHTGGTATADKLAECEVCGKEYGEYAKPEPTPTPDPTPTPTPTPTPGDPLPYEDVAEADWFYKAVEYTYLEGLMTGMDPTHFGPYGQLSRAQFALMLYRMEGENAVETEKTFGDITGDEWYGPAVLWAAENGIVTGYQDGNFGPSDLITREQMAVMMHRYAKYLKQDVSGDFDISHFADADSVSPFAADAMKWAAGTRTFGSVIITGKDNGTRLDPQGNTARCEAAVIIQRFLTK